MYCVLYSRDIIFDVKAREREMEDAEFRKKKLADSLKVKKFVQLKMFDPRNRRTWADFLNFFIL